MCAHTRATDLSLPLETAALLSQETGKERSQSFIMLLFEAISAKSSSACHLTGQNEGLQTSFCTRYFTNMC